MGILDNAKDVARLALEVGKMDLHQKAVDLMAQLVELSEENAGLRAKLAASDERKRIGALLTPHRDAYWKREDGKVDGPFCTNCWDGEALLIRIHKLNTKSFPYPCCPRCNVRIGHTGPPPADGAAETANPQPARGSVVHRTPLR